MNPTTTTRLSGLTIVLPCFNEAENLRDAVRYATIAAERCAVRHEIVVVDDGSSDDTVGVACELVLRDPRVRLVVHAENRGYGPALRSGIAAARRRQAGQGRRLARRTLRELADLRRTPARPVGI